MTNLDQLCGICGARFGEHQAPTPRCPDGDHFRAADLFQPSQGHRERIYDQRRMLLDAARKGVQPLWAPQYGIDDQGRRAVQGWTLDNRAELEDAARRWRQHVAQHGDETQTPEALMRLVGTIGGQGE